MMSRILFSLLVFAMLSNVMFAQDKNYAKHTVSKGETITQIATKYNVTPYDIYKLNPDSQNGIKESDVLLIPSSTVKTTAVKAKTTSNKTHVVKAKETFYSIAREYQISFEDLKNANPETFAAGLKIGQTIKIPEAGEVVAAPKPSTPKEPVAEPKPISAVVSRSNTEKSIYHIVEPKETKFGIAKKYGITVQELEQRNPAIVSNLTIGYKLIISGITSEPEPKSVAETRGEVAKPKPVTTEIVHDEVVTTETVRTLTKNGYANYEVKQGETLFSLSQYFNITPEELTKLNPTLSDGVKTGMILKVPGKGTIKTDSGSTAKYADPKKPVVVNTERKKLVMLLPFNASKIQSDTLKTIDVRLKKDAFLNMTLDFYSGALMAIDSAKTLGLNVDVSIFDSEESKLNSSVESIVKKNNLQDADAIIGPFYQQYVEKVAELVQEKKVPVISPLSKEIGKPFPNLYQAMPPSDFGKKAIFDYMMANNANIIVVSDPKKVFNKDFITNNYPAAVFVTLLDNGALDVANLKSLLVKGKKNYVILDSERTGLILGTTNVLLNEMSNFEIQLAIIEPNDTLDFEEISMKRLTILKMLYPSLIRENVSPQAVAFENDYKEKNKVFPSQYAVRGFDITFDTLMRLTQGKSFETSAAELKSEQIESKFEYSKKGKDGYVNKGIYIMEYQDDLSVKQVN